MSLELPRRTYADLYGPTKGDRIRLADSELIIEIEDARGPARSPRCGRSHP